MYLFTVTVWSAGIGGERVHKSYGVVSEDDVGARKEAVRQFNATYSYMGDVLFCTVDMAGDVDHIKIDSQAG